MDDWSSTGKNIEYKIDEGYLYLRVPVSADDIARAEPSRTGKSKIVGSTGGFVMVEDIRFGLNVITK